jgi:predicted DNA-binding transcriptional regulator AlpA
MPKLRTEKQISTSITQFDALPDAAFIDARTVCALLMCGNTSLWRHIHAGRLPPPQKFGRSSRWNVGVIRRALAVEQ